MKKNLLFIFLFGMGISSIFYSCTKNPPAPIDTGFLHGVYIVNEGAYNHNNGSISYIDPDSSYIINNVFNKVNHRPLGDVVQSFTVADDKGLIVVNHSAKVEVVDMRTFVSLGVITGCNYPRFIMYLGNDQAYLTNGAYAGKVYVLNLNNLSITDSIPVGNGPEEMIRAGEYVYVANSGGWSHDSTVSVIDVNHKKVIKTIKTGDNPVDMVMDFRGDIWVLCKGNVVYDQNWNIVSETDSKLQIISPSLQQVVKSYIIGQKGDYFNPVRLAIDNMRETIYYAEHDGIYRMNIDDMQVPGSPFITGKYYGLETDPLNGIIYVLDAKDFNSPGFLSRYSPDGTLYDTASVGIAPNGVDFN